MSKDEFNNIIRAFGEVKNPDNTLKGLHEILNLLNDVMAILTYIEELRDLKKLIERIDSEHWIMKDYFTVGEVAEYTSFSKSLIYKIIRERDITVYKLDKIVYIKKSDLLNYIDKYERRSHQTHKPVVFNSEKLLQNLKAQRHKAKLLETIK